ncbi:MAG TPA: transketolase C-terminal domain-containing protein, partial [Flavipsychrobacter sp.]|nr:transketolase C-terminal domain-containing protein [Flavipsychrobacter sp.]
EGQEIAILSLGHPGNFALDACKLLLIDGVSPAVYDMRFAKPLDEPLLHQIAKKFKKIITVEDGTIVGGFGSAVLEFLAQHNYTVTVKMLGIPDRLVEHGKPEQLYKECKFDAEGIASAVREMVGVKVTVS